MSQPPEKACFASADNASSERKQTAQIERKRNETGLTGSLLGRALLNGIICLLLVIAATRLGDVPLHIGSIVIASLTLLSFLVIELSPYHVFAFPAGVAACLMFLLWGPGVAPLIITGWTLSIIIQYALWQRRRWSFSPHSLEALEHATFPFTLIHLIQRRVPPMVDWITAMIVSTPFYHFSGGQFPTRMETWAELGTVTGFLLSVNLVWLGICEVRARLWRIGSHLSQPESFRLFTRTLLAVFVPLPGTVLILFALSQYSDKGAMILILSTGASVPLHYALKSFLTANVSYLKVQQEQDRHRQAVMLASHTSLIVHEVLHEVGTLNLLLHLSEQTLRKDGTSQMSLRSTLADMRQVVQQLERAIEQFRVYLRQQGGQYEPLSIQEVVREAIETLRIRSEHIFRVHTDGISNADLVLGDTLLVENAVQNVLRNALEASPPAGPIGLELTKDEIGRNIQISIVDRGSGMTPEGVEEAFNPYHTTKTKGLGLGLYLAREIIEAHGGYVKITSQLHKGTTVLLSLPLLERTP